MAFHGFLQFFSRVTLFGSLQAELGENRIAENDAEHLSDVLFDKTMVVGVSFAFWGIIAGS